MTPPRSSARLEQERREDLKRRALVSLRQSTRTLAAAQRNIELSLEVALVNGATEQEVAAARDLTKRVLP